MTKTTINSFSFICFDSYVIQHPVLGSYWYHWSFIVFSKTCQSCQGYSFSLTCLSTDKRRSPLYRPPFTEKRSESHFRRRTDINPGAFVAERSQITAKLKHYSVSQAAAFRQLDTETFRKVSGWSEMAKDKTHTHTFACMHLHTHTH